MISSVSGTRYALRINDDILDEDDIFETYEEALKVARHILKEDDVDYIHVLELQQVVTKLDILEKRGR